MDRPKSLPAEKRRAATVETVIELAAEQNPSSITTTAIAKHMQITPSLFGIGTVAARYTYKIGPTFAR